jgi:hypothetical protein
MARRDRAAAATALLEPGEELLIELNGVVPGYTRWSGVGGVIAVIVALTVPRLLDLPFLAGVVVIVVVLAAAFLLLYVIVGKPLAARSAAPLVSPYLAVALTNRRLLLLDRALGGDTGQLVEECSRHDIGALRHRPASLLLPHRLTYVIAGARRREFEFPRSEPVGEFVDRCDGR